MPRVTLSCREITPDHNRDVGISKSHRPGQVSRGNTYTYCRRSSKVHSCQFEAQSLRREKIIVTCMEARRRLIPCADWIWNPGRGTVNSQGHRTGEPPRAPFTLLLTTCRDDEDRRFSALPGSCCPDQVAFRWIERRASLYSVRDAFCRRGNSGRTRG